ncbi:peptide-methionine (S)-S-oxide reductase [Halospina denitrificans]|uniref:Peptide methionine sulfoxide reductase MsrA n=1 Tax=Halospina denitrificans TaxID=332522 RepID=A0A4R7JSS4_9GAMM|nr:peptide-methionine (S)-S-oxide reductase MsrA [Halospina denitrificans]TDT41342.1 peptide-methionine (S)-S-oxide reductase [Halospina denitrificans]
MRWFGAALVAVITLSAPVLAQSQDQDVETAIFAGGCFWCMEPPYDKLDGVLATTSGFSGGDIEDPSYEEVAGGNTKHIEVVQVRYNPDKVSYGKLLDVFWKNIDPFDDGGQFCDRGYQYTTAIFVNSEEQREAAEASKRELKGRFDQPIVTPIRNAKPFYAAKEYHQNYYEKRPLRYKFYRTSCGRDGRLDEVWGEDR